MMKRNPLILTLTTLGLLASGCANLQLDYDPPSVGPTAILEIKSTVQINNRRVLVHGVDICSEAGATIAGLLQSRVPGIPSSEEVRISVSANKEVAISSPFFDYEDIEFKATSTIFKSRYCQPVLAFVPEEGKRYRITFGACSATLGEVKDGVVSPLNASLYDGCELYPAFKDNKKSFFLRPRTTNPAAKTEPAQVTAEIKRQWQALQQDSEVRPPSMWGTYMDNWRLQVERIGNLNYPEEIRRRRLTGNVTLDVAVKSNGTLDSVKVVRSSGSELLDSAAVAIVRRAAPFAPFPPDLSAEADVVHIIRKWAFAQSLVSDQHNPVSPSPEAGELSGDEK